VVRDTHECSYGPAITAYTISFSAELNDQDEEIPFQRILINVELSDRYPVQQDIENRANEDGPVSK
jgi:hypothetical protein